MSRFKLTFVALLVAVGGTQARAANIVLNGNFATGDFTDWTANGSSSAPWEVDAAGGHGNNPYPGDTFFASTGCVGAQCITGTSSQQASLSQVLSDVVATSYTLTFEFGTGANSMPNELNVMWDGSSVLDLGPSGTLGQIANYTLYQVTGLTGSGSDTLTFLGRQDPGWDELDDISVSASSSSTTPEPATILLVGGVLPVFALLRRRLLS